MAGKNNIVTFEEARRASKRRRRSAVSGSHPSKNLTVAVGAPQASAKKAARRRKGGSQPVGDQLTRRADRQATRKAAADTRKAPMAATRKQAREASKRRRTKERADKKFTKLYGGASGSSAAASQGVGPRAAVYQTKMGGKHRKASKALATAKDGLSAASGFIGGIRLPSLPAFPKMPRRVLAGILCAAFAVLMLYTPAQQCYQQVRDRDRAAAEYAAVLDRNQALADSVDNLQSEEGIEDKAHAEYGMVKEDEQAGSVGGIDVQSSTDFVANVVPGGVPAPDTWYSGFLDLLFGYTNAA